MDVFGGFVKEVRFDGESGEFETKEWQNLHQEFTSNLIILNEVPSTVCCTFNKSVLFKSSALPVPFPF